MSNADLYEQEPLNASTEKLLAPVQQAVRLITAPEQGKPSHSRLFHIYIFLSLVGFAGLIILVRLSQVNAVDMSITFQLQREIPLWAKGILINVSWFGYLGQSIALTLLVAGLLYLLKLRVEPAMIVGSVICALIINQIVKEAVRRLRPGTGWVLVPQDLDSYGFPSGHVVFYIVLFGFLAYLALTLWKSGWLRAALVSLCTLMILLVGPSRIYMGEHWATDVIAAYVLGFLILSITIYIYRRIRKWYSHRQPAAPGAEVS
jgi:membrane-associated phospholipid phosphatase